MQQDDRILRTMRAMEWSRIKGMFEAILDTYWVDRERYDRFEEATNNLIEIVEGEALLE